MTAAPRVVPLVTPAAEVTLVCRVREQAAVITEILPVAVIIPAVSRDYYRKTLNFRERKEGWCTRGTSC
jgi:hypothetical protein